jgi:hypothetical protein
MVFASVAEVTTMAQWRKLLLVTAGCTPCTRQDRVGKDKPCVQLVCSCRAIGPVEGKKTARYSRFLLLVSWMHLGAEATGWN